MSEAVSSARDSRAVGFRSERVRNARERVSFMKPVHFSCDLQGKKQPLTHFWEHTVGSGHALLALRADWQEQLRRCHAELGFRYVRFHGLLSDAVGTFAI